MAKKGIDVSVYQGDIDWAKAKKEIDFAILRVGYGQDIKSQDDSKWSKNVKGCIDNNIPYGVYIYSYATTVAAAKGEADHVLRLIKGKKLSYPVFYDMEDASQYRLTKNELGNIADAFCKRIKASGFYPAIYANTNWFNNKLTSSVFNKYDKWVAQYASSCQYKGKYTMWQYSSNGKVSGITGRVDMNYCYVNYPSIIDGTSSDDTTISKTEFVKSVQRYYGYEATGTATDSLLSKTETISAKVNSTHILVRDIQRRLMSMGFTAVGSIDGEAGPKFTTAVNELQHENKIEENGSVKAHSNTWKVLLGMSLPEPSTPDTPIPEPSTLPDYYSGGINESKVPYKEPTMEPGGIALHPYTTVAIARAFSDQTNFKIKTIQNSVNIK